MSVPSNINNQTPTIPVDQSIYEYSTTKKCDLGTRLEVGERVFYYAQASASIGGGTVVCSPAPVASHQSGILAIAAATAGAKVLSATSSANVAANAYEDGFFGAATGAAIGVTLKVANNDSGATGLAVRLYDALPVTITSGTGFWLMPNPYKNVFVGSQQVDAPAGVAPIAVTSGGYFWLQTYGPANPTHAAATVAAAALRLGTTGGVAAMFDATTNGGIAATGTIIGKNSVLAATAGQANPVFLTLRP